MSAKDRLKAEGGNTAGIALGGNVVGQGAALLPASGPTMYAGTTRLKGALALPVDRVFPDPDQPRQEFDDAEIQRLARSLMDRGQLQPIRVRPDPEGQRWIIIAGERRWRAAQVAGLATVAAVEVTGTLTTEAILEDQLVENCLRVDLRPIERARAFRSLMDRLSLTQDQLAQRLSLSEASVNVALSLLKLPESVQAVVEQGGLPPSSAALLTKLDDPAEQERVATDAVRAGLTRDELKAYVAGKTPGKAKGAAPRQRREEIRLDGGVRVVVILPEPTAPDSAVELALKRAAAQFKIERRERDVA